MRKFSSYGPVDKDLHYYVPRQALIDRACTQLVGENPNAPGHYLTVWAPPQRGKTWVMQEVVRRLQNNPRFDAVMLNVAHLRTETDAQKVMTFIARELAAQPSKEIAWFETTFTSTVLDKPLILILDEFDTLTAKVIEALTGVFRNIYISRQVESRDLLLHGLALVGVTPLLAVDTKVPYNIQRSFRIPDLTLEEVREMFAWYVRESGQAIEQAVIERLFRETRGHAGLTSWLGQLFTETYNEHKDRPITMAHFERAYTLAHESPNERIAQLVRKACTAPYKDTVLGAFSSGPHVPFHYHDSVSHFLHTRGILDATPAKFACPFIQRRLFSHFTGDLFGQMGRVHEPSADLSDTITQSSLNVENLLRRYETYLRENRDWLLKDTPRRADLRPYEVVYHFNLYRYLASFLQGHGGRMWPEFPTGNGKVDLIIRYAGKTYGVEVKSFSTQYEYREALRQAARYGERLELEEITLAFFVEYVDETNRARYEVAYEDEETGVTVRPVFVETGR